MFLLNFILACLVQADGPLKVMISMGLGTNSHIKPLLEVGSMLRDRNHTVFYSSLESNKKFNKPYQLPFVSLGNEEEPKEDVRVLMKRFFSKIVVSNPSKEMATSFGRIGPKTYNITYPAILRVMELERPDVVLCDFIATACRDAAQMLGIPLVTGFQATDFFGVTSSPFITTDLAYGSITTEKQTFFQRFKSKVIHPLLDHYYYYPMVKNTNIVREKYGVPPASTPFGDFSVSLGLSSSFVGFEAPMNFPPNIKIIGPIKSKTYPPLTPKLAEFLETHPKTLYVAFGSAILLSEFDIRNLVVGCLQAIAEDSIDGVLWGLGKTLHEDFPEKFTFNGTVITREQIFSDQMPHIQPLDWAPQTSILEHENTKLFISHGGLESAFEAIITGTPILCMPYLGDQPRNARKLEDAGVGKHLERITATPSKVSDNIKQIVDDNTGSFAANVKRMRIIAEYNSRRKESGADSVEEYVYTAQACRPLYPHKYGEIPCELKHLSPASRNMSYIQANAMDVYAAAIFLTLALIYATITIAWKLSTNTFSSPDDPVKKSQ